MTFLLNHTCIKIRSKSKLPMRSPNPTGGDEYKTVSGPFFARALLKRNNLRGLSAGWWGRKRRREEKKEEKREREKKKRLLPREGFGIRLLSSTSSHNIWPTSISLWFPRRVRPRNRPPSFPFEKEKRDRKGEDRKRRRKKLVVLLTPFPQKMIRLLMLRVDPALCNAFAG